MLDFASKICYSFRVEKLALRLSARTKSTGRQHIPRRVWSSYGTVHLADPYGASRELNSRKAPNILQSQWADATPLFQPPWLCMSFWQLSGFLYSSIFRWMLTTERLVRILKKNKMNNPFIRIPGMSAMRCPYCGSPVVLRSADGIYKENHANTKLYVCSR